jgi:hypothetical protein
MVRSLMTLVPIATFSRLFMIPHQYYPHPSSLSVLMNTLEPPIPHPIDAMVANSPGLAPDFPMHVPSHCTVTAQACVWHQW